jgi:deoxyribodipyrimidine photolyase-related protein
MKLTCSIIFPNQLFKESPLLKKNSEVFLVEEFLFFKQYNFHKQKILFHRSSMKYYNEYLSNMGVKVNYIDSYNDLSDIRNLIIELSKKGFKEIEYIDSVDYLLERRINKFAIENKIKLIKHDSLLFINDQEDLNSFFKPEKKKFFHTTFYISQRKKLNILIDKNFNPDGGKWSFDMVNRKKYPKNIRPPDILFPKKNKFLSDGIKYVENYFPSNYGVINEDFKYPNNHVDAEKWFQDFLENRFEDFGSYEDAIVSEEVLLNHSLLSPLINSGLLSPKLIVDKAISFYDKNTIPLNSIEGFIRQIIGWREFIRGIYISKGSHERTRNFWNFNKKIPASFYSGTTGIIPIDLTIQKINQTGYCHHIERLMVLGNFMVLCEFDPDEVYKWFMEMFIDSYDWVMVPNVYGMSQFSDGGLMSTKPYISSSNYLFKMSDYKKGEWQIIWDGLFWRFMDKHRGFFVKNPRMRILVSTFDKMNSEKKSNILEQAENFLENQ